jgi:hypothetical protein
MVITENMQANKPLSTSAIEDVTSTFLQNSFEQDLGFENSVYVTALETIEIDPSDLEASIGPTRNTSDATGERRTQDADNMLFLYVDGIVGIRDGIFDGTASVQQFIASSLQNSFQDRHKLLEMMQGHPDTSLQSVTLVELSSQLEICPNDLRCHHGSTCSQTDDGSFACDCLTAPIIVDGVQCEYAATQFCLNNSDAMVHSFCVNNGECIKTDAPASSEHPGCTCPEPYEGARCELIINELSAERSQNLVSEDENSSPNDGLSAGDYAILIIIGIGAVLTTIIVVYKTMNKAKPQPKRKQDKVDDIEAGLAEKSVLEAAEGASDKQQTPDDSAAQVADEQSMEAEPTVASADTEGAVHSDPCQEEDANKQDGGKQDREPPQYYSSKDSTKGSEEEKEEVQPYADEDYTVCADISAQFTSGRDDGAAQDAESVEHEDSPEKSTADNEENLDTVAVENTDDAGIVDPEDTSDDQPSDTHP